MMKLEEIERVYFIGIGGIGMSAIARYFLNRDCRVAGYDRTCTPLTTALTQEGAFVSYNDDSSLIPIDFLEDKQHTLVVYTPAVPQNADILSCFRRRGLNVMKRSEVLGIISKGQFCIAIAGTHGKTTTSCMIAHLLTASGYGCTAFLGGIATNYNSNFLIDSNDVVVVEADEYDRSFLTLSPDISVITSMDADHLDIYGDVSQMHESFRLFADCLKPNGMLLVKEGLPVPGIGYSATGKSGTGARNIRVQNSSFLFDYFDGTNNIAGIELQLPGKHNVENAVAAIAVALKLGVNAVKVKAAVSSFKGVRRRFEYIVKTDAHIYIDDYAHHPVELKACFDAVRMLYPGKKLTVVFQPHLFSRTRDFADDFARVLETADDLLLLEIYPARELPIDGIDSEYLLDKVVLKDKQVCTKSNLVEQIRIKQPELLLTVGAGDIDTLVQPLKKVLADV